MCEREPEKEVVTEREIERGRAVKVGERDLLLTVKAIVNCWSKGSQTFYANNNWPHWLVSYLNSTPPPAPTPLPAAFKYPLLCINGTF